MTDTYTDHFISYAHDIQWLLKEEEEETLEQLTEIIPLSKEHQLDLSDRLTRFRIRCCSESFALGIEMGLRITREIPIR